MKVQVLTESHRRDHQSVLVVVSIIALACLFFSCVCGILSLTTTRWVVVENLRSIGLSGCKKDQVPSFTVEISPLRFCAAGHCHNRKFLKTISFLERLLPCTNLSVAQGLEDLSFGFDSSSCFRRPSEIEALNYVVVGTGCLGIMCAFIAVLLLIHYIVKYMSSFFLERARLAASDALEPLRFGHSDEERTAKLHQIEAAVETVRLSVDKHYHGDLRQQVFVDVSIFFSLVGYTSMVAVFNYINNSFTHCGKSVCTHYLDSLAMLHNLQRQNTGTFCGFGMSFMFAVGSLTFSALALLGLCVIGFSTWLSGGSIQGSSTQLCGVLQQVHKKLCKRHSLLQRTLPLLPPLAAHPSSQHGELDRFGQELGALEELESIQREKHRTAERVLRQGRIGFYARKVEQCFRLEHLHQFILDWFWGPVLDLHLEEGVYRRNIVYEAVEKYEELVSRYQTTFTRNVAPVNWLERELFSFPAEESTSPPLASKMLSPLERPSTSPSTRCHCTSSKRRGSMPCSLCVSSDSEKEERSPAEVSILVPPTITINVDTPKRSHHSVSPIPKGTVGTPTPIRSLFEATPSTGDLLRRRDDSPQGLRLLVSPYSSLGSVAEREVALFRAASRRTISFFDRVRMPSRRASFFLAGTGAPSAL